MIEDNKDFEDKLHCIQEYTRKNCTQEDRECANPFGELDQAAGGLQQEHDVPLHPAGVKIIPAGETKKKKTSRLW